MQQADYGTYSGLVVDNADPEGRGRIRAQIPQVLSGSMSAWAEPSISVGARVPALGERVFIFFDGGYIPRPVFHASRP